MYMVFQYIILCMMSWGIFLVAFSCIFRKSIYFDEKIEAPLTPALAPGASIGKNMVTEVDLYKGYLYYILIKDYTFI